MYDNPCNNCENFEQCRSKMDTPMMNMPMANMSMENMNMAHMNMANMNMANMPMMKMPAFEEDDEKVKKLYPKSYKRMYPIVKRHCDMLVARYGTMYCPSKEEMDDITEDIYDKCEDYYRDDYDDEDFNYAGNFDYDEDLNDVIDSNDMRQRRRRRRRIRTPGVRDFIKVLFLQDLIGRRNYYGYY